MIKLAPESCVADPLTPERWLSDEGIYLQADFL